MNQALANPLRIPAAEPARDTPPRTALTRLDILAVFILVGNLSLGRAFAHLGVSPLYIGELSLAVFLLARWQMLLGTAEETRDRPESLGLLTGLFILSGLYGVAQCGRGILAGYDRMVALQNLAFHAYPLFLFFGLWVGVRHRDIMPALFRFLAWVHGIYGIAFMSLLYRVSADDVRVPGEVGWFGDPVGSAVVLLGLLSFERKLSRVWLPFLLNVGVLMALQIRAELTGLAVGVLLWGFLSGHLLRLCGLALLGGSLMLAAAAVDLRIPSPATRGGEISAAAFVGKQIAAIDLETARAFKPDADVDADTAAWRTGWWRAIWRMVHDTPERMLFGPGYGYPIWDLHPDGLPDFKLRTPHCVFIYALGYTGWVGVLLFYTMQLNLAWLLWRAYRVSGQPFGLCLWAMLLVKGTFENFFEAPFNAIPFYLLVGLALAPLCGTAPSGTRGRHPLDGGLLCDSLN